MCHLISSQSLAWASLVILGILRSPPSVIKVFVNHMVSVPGTRNHNDNDRGSGLLFLLWPLLEDLTDHRSSTECNRDIYVSGHYLQKRFIVLSDDSMWTLVICVEDKRPYMWLTDNKRNHEIIAMPSVMFHLKIPRLSLVSSVFVNQHISLPWSLSYYLFWDIEWSRGSCSKSGQPGNNSWSVSMHSHH